MLRAAVAAGAGRERPQQVDLGKKFKVITRAHRACLHKILVGVTGKTGAHEDIEHIVHMHFGLMQRKPGFRGQGAGQVRMAAMVVS